jgi:hypothetical protein
MQKRALLAPKSGMNKFKIEGKQNPASERGTK